MAISSSDRSRTPDPDPAATAGRRRAAQQQLVQVLTDEIIRQVIPPGTHLDEASLAKRFTLSRTPVRAALQELCARNLAEHIPFRGVIVRAISPADIEALFEAMSEIEGLCGRLAAVRMGISDRARLLALHEAMAALARDGDHAGYAALNGQFHDLIARAAGNAEIHAISAALRARIAPYRHSQLRDPGRLQRSCAEHGQICDALLAQNGAMAELALKRHLISAAHEVMLQRGPVEPTKDKDHADRD